MKVYIIFKYVICSSILCCFPYFSFAQTNSVIVEKQSEVEIGDSLINEDFKHISSFTSLKPMAQGELLTIPSSHSFQVLFQKEESYSKGADKAIGNFDFAGFVPENMTSSRKGILSINHETNPGGVSMLDVHYDQSKERWVVDESQSINFNMPSIVKTRSNCSGCITSWGTVITCEESIVPGDSNSDGYEDVGWNIEIDPKTKSVREYGNGKPEKLWAMGRMKHENVVFKDSLIAYFGDDSPDGCVYKFVADSKMNFYSGTLYVLKLDAPLINNEPVAFSGRWELVPNKTPQECNITKTLALKLGATIFNGVEDVDISPIDGRVYFAVKGNSRTYRFKDNGSSVSDFETFVGGKSYVINFAGGQMLEDWGMGNDNLTFDDHGNLWILQDGGRNHVWLVKPDHTQKFPKVELFMITPIGSEPTGMTFTPDYKFMFISIQHPSALNKISQKDATGNSYVMNKDMTIVISRKEYLDGTR